MIITRTPYRLSLFGGGTDFPAWYRRPGGAVLAGAIDKYCYLTLRELPPFFSHRYRIVYSKVENTNSHSEIQHPTVRAVFEHFDLTSGLELHHDGDLPARSGIGSSAAFSVGLVHAVRELSGLPTDSWTLAQDAIYVEQELMKEVGGSQDQVTCAVGGINRLDFSLTGEISASSSQYLRQAAHDFSRWLVLLYAGTPRSSSMVSAGLLPRLEAEDDGHLRRLQEMVGEAVDLLIQRSEESFQRLGELLHESWCLKRDLNPMAVTDELGSLYEQARQVGAIGGKVSGAGGGGFMLFCVPPDQQTRFVADLPPHALHVPFEFVDNGSQVIYQS